MGLGGIALAHLLGIRPAAANSPVPTHPGILPALHFPPKAKRVIYLFMAGGPSQLETFDYKPLLNQRNGQDLPESVRMGQRLTGMSGNQATLPLAGSIFKFQQHGKNGLWVSELLPHTAKIVDDLCIVCSNYTEAINHDPAITFMQTGSEMSGRPSIGAWLSYGLGSDNDNLPAFVVLITPGKVDQPLYSRLWGTGFLPSEFQGVQFRSGKEPVLYLSNPSGLAAGGRRLMLDRLRELNKIQKDQLADPGLDARIQQYEMAFHLQTSVPEVVDTSKESAATFDLYGPDSRKPGTFAANCLLARRLAERGVKFIQLYHQGWDQHGNLPKGIATQCKETDQASAALVTDLKQRGLLDDTLVIWGGEFGRTNYSQGKLTSNDYGRDHHPRCFTTWMAGGGVRSGLVYGETCEFGYNVVKDPVHVHDFHATLLRLLGIDHEQLTFKYQGRRFRLTDVSGRVVQGLLA
ncbi:MAG: sulfatase [Verrucomicrobia bacterium]|nr:MAG: sulfatase [Verrucomicrobiota bacterium]